MKKSTHRHKAKTVRPRTILSFVLCLVLAVSLGAQPVLGVQDASAQAQPDDAVVSALESELVSEIPEEPVEEPAESSEAPVESSPEEALISTEESAVEAEPESGLEEEVPEYYTYTFNMGSFGTTELEVAANSYPMQVPSIPSLPAASVLGWYDENGEMVYPMSTPATADRTFTARWRRNIGDILNTSSHDAYIKGYEKGTFRPTAGITRAEASQLFYNLLRNKSWEVATFSDVPAEKWYATPVGVMATLGIIQGYADGSFKPAKQITRAEFVKMAVSFSTIVDGENNFSDVKPGSWMEPYVVTASANGWVGGYTDDTFRPGNTITRAEAVTIINRILGRTPPENVAELENVKNFYDNFPTYWAYGQIVEASNSHSYSKGVESETWYSYEQDTSVVTEGGWVEDGGTRYYLDADTQKFLRGSHTIDGVQYVFDSVTGASFTGFKTVGAWTRYFKNGIIVEDISNLGVVSGPYMIKVYKNSNYLIIFAKDSNGKYTIPVRSMLTSCGYGTPTGTYYTPAKYRWLKMVGNTYAQWCTQISGNYLFHCVPYWTHNNFDLEVLEYNNLGNTRSMGCIRLNCRDAKWIYDNCSLGTQAVITTRESSGPLAKPKGIQIPSWHTWDPTDPTANWKCAQRGCH